MNDLPRDRLRDLIVRHGPELCDAVARCDNLIRDACPEFPREVFVLGCALRDGVAEGLQAPAAWAGLEDERARLAYRLQDRYALTREAATWAVDSWSLALGLLPRSWAPGPRPMAATGPAPPTPPPKTLTVAKLGGAHHRTIAEAVQKAEPGTQIRIKPGLYRETVVLDRDVELIGDGPLHEIVIEQTEGNCLRMATENAAARNLTLRRRCPSGERSFTAVDITQGRLVLEDCDITAEKASGVAVHGPTAEPIIRRCRIHDCGRAGIFFYEAGRGFVEDCDISGNGNPCIVVRQKSNPTVLRCRLHESRQNGVWIGEEGLGHFVDCVIERNEMAGVLVDGGSQPRFERCRIREGRAAGFALGGKSLTSLDGCEIRGNQGIGIHVYGESAPQVDRCLVEHNKGHGIWVTEKSGGRFERCVLRNQEKAQVAVSSEANPTFLDCRISNGKASGMFIYAQGKGVIERCEFSGHGARFPAVVLRGVVNPIFRRCLIHDEPSNGVWICEGGSGNFEWCEIRATGKHAIQIDAKCRVRLTDSVLSDSQGSGILISQSTAVVSRCRITGHQLAGIHVKSGGEVAVDGSTITGNTFEAVWVEAEGVARVSDCDLSSNKRGSRVLAQGSRVVLSDNQAEEGTSIGVECPECGTDFQVNQPGDVICTNEDCKSEFAVDQDGDLIQEDEDQDDEDLDPDDDEDEE